MKYKIRNLIKNNDIIPNIIETYPKKALLAQTDDEFYDILFDNECNVLCYHITRLTAQEITNIKENGLSFGGKELLFKKVENLPSCCDWFKEELVAHIKNLHDTQADSLLCASYGYLDFDNDTACDNAFRTNWGGETIYRYYDEGNDFQDEHLKKIHSTLQAISCPYIIIIRVPIWAFCNAEHYNLYERLKTAKDKKYIAASLYISNVLPEIIDIVDLNTYSGIDFD